MTTKTKTATHTPGPWRLAKYFSTETDSLHIVADVPRFGQWEIAMASDQAGANARLMAAAPELLEALQRAEMAMLGYTHRNDIITNALAAARAAIEKAKQA